jgi:hypothetical protein
MSIFVLIILGVVVIVYDWRQMHQRDRKHMLPKGRLVDRNGKPI